jgi:hypothetical protein
VFIFCFSFVYNLRLKALNCHIQINDEDPDHTKAIKENEYIPQNNGHPQLWQQYLPNRSSGPVKCTQCKKPRHTVERCFVKFPGLRNKKNGQRENSANQSQNNKDKNTVNFVNETAIQRTITSLWKGQKENYKPSSQESTRYKKIVTIHQTFRHLRN